MYYHKEAFPGYGMNPKFLIRPDLICTSTNENVKDNESNSWVSNKLDLSTPGRGHRHRFCLFRFAKTISLLHLVREQILYIVGLSKAQRGHEAVET
jgi:hypothetical protein